MIALGTTLSFGEEQIDDISRAISRLRQRVIWLLRENAPAQIGNNTKIVNWLPMNDILGEQLLLFEGEQVGSNPCLAVLGFRDTHYIHFFVLDAKTQQVHNLIACGPTFALWVTTKICIGQD